jgi:hypothetical protein
MAFLKADMVDYLSTISLNFQPTTILEEKSINNADGTEFYNFSKRYSGLRENISAYSQHPISCNFDSPFKPLLSFKRESTEILR